MKKWIILSSIVGFSFVSSAQTFPIDTIVALQNVEVHGTRLGGLSGGEIKRLDVKGNVTSSTGTAADAFRQIPSLSTDIEGGLTFRGSTKTGLLLNGVPYGLLEEYSGDVLIQLPALFFNQIEVTSYPSIQNIPDGDAGLLDLTSSYTVTDSPLQVLLGAGWYERYNAGIIVNLHPDRFHIAGRYNYRREYRKRAFQKITTNAAGTTEMNNNASARPDVHLADLEVGYDLTQKDVLSIYGLYYLMDYSRYGGINNTRKNQAGEILNKMLRHRFNDQRQEAYAAEVRWKHQFTLPNDYLEVLFNYNNFSYDEDNDYKNENPTTGAILARDNLFIYQQKDNYFLKASYQKTFADNLSFKTGYIGRFSREEYTTDTNNFIEGNWIHNPQKSDAYNFTRDTHLLYASLIKEWNRFSTEVGMQAEQSNQKIRNDKQDRFHLYPRVRLSYQIGETDALSLNYIQRVIRPLGKDLNHFVDISDATHIIQGNPDLKDERIHSVELSYALNLSHLRFSPAFYYRKRTSRIMEIVRTEEEQTIWKKENVGSSRLLGTELSASWSPSRLLSLGIAGNIYRDEIDGRTIGYNEKKSMICWDVKGTFNFHLTANTEIQLDGYHISDQLTPQGEIKSRYTVNAGISQYLFDRKLQLNLSVNNIFDSLEETTIINTENQQMKQVRNRDAQVAWFSLTFSPSKI